MATENTIAAKPESPGQFALRIMEALRAVENEIEQAVEQDTTGALEPLKGYLESIEWGDLSTIIVNDAGRGVLLPAAIKPAPAIPATSELAKESPAPAETITLTDQELADYFCIEQVLADISRALFRMDDIIAVAPEIDRNDLQMLQEKLNEARPLALAFVAQKITSGISSEPERQALLRRKQCRTAH